MLKKAITYTDYNDVERTEDFFFNLSKAELIEMQVSVKEGMDEVLQKIVDTEDRKELYAMFKKIVLDSVGEKSEDGRRFMKSEQIQSNFVESPAFDVLIMQLATDADMASAFIRGIMPKDLGPNFDAAVKEELRRQTPAE